MKYLLIFLVSFSFNIFCYSQNDNSVEFYFLEKLNEYREKRRIPKLELDSNLTKAAQDHANYIHYEVTKNLNPKGYSHIQNNLDNPYYSGVKPVDRLSKYKDTKYKKTGENIVRFGNNTNKGIAEFIFKLWLTSPDHKKIMLDKSYKKIGLGLKYDKNNNKIKNGYAVLLLSN